MQYNNIHIVPTTDTNGENRFGREHEANVESDTSPQQPTDSSTQQGQHTNGDEQDSPSSPITKKNQRKENSIIKRYTFSFLLISFKY